VTFCLSRWTEALHCGNVAHIIARMFLDTLSKNPTYFIEVCITVVLSICVHELAHGVIAIWHGDRTPIETGHMTLNPMIHMGLMSFILLAVAGIAWGSMPITPSRLRGRHARALVALAGPASNVIMALLSLTALGLWLRSGGYAKRGTTIYTVSHFLLIFGTVNVSLALFNLLPVPPLDGSNALADFSQAFARLMLRLRAGGGLGVVFLLIFFFAGTYIVRLGNDLSLRYLTLLRGH